MKTDERNKFAIKSFLGEYLDLKKDKDNELATVDSIRKGVEFKGANLWILIFAIFMASLGLNVNSTAVIIGAMLISPLMGPTMGGTLCRTERLRINETLFKELSHNDRFQCDNGYYLLPSCSYCRFTVRAAGTYIAHYL